MFCDQVKKLAVHSVSPKPVGVFEGGFKKNKKRKNLTTSNSKNQIIREQCSSWRWESAEWRKVEISCWTRKKIGFALSFLGNPVFSTPPNLGEKAKLPS
jgi:hypothetical protein